MAYITARRQASQKRHHDDGIPLQPAEKWGQWAGLSRYTNKLSTQMRNGVMSPEEYARVLRILECDELALNYYYDNPGNVSI